MGPVAGLTSELVWGFNELYLADVSSHVDIADELYWPDAGYGSEPVLPKYPVSAAVEMTC